MSNALRMLTACFTHQPVYSLLSRCMECDEPIRISTMYCATCAIQIEAGVRTPTPRPWLESWEDSC